MIDDLIDIVRLLIVGAFVFGACLVSAASWVKARDDFGGRGR